MASQVSAGLLRDIWTAAGGPADALKSVEFLENGELPSVFAVTDLAAASVGAASLAIAEFSAARFGRRPDVTVDRRLASFWFWYSLRPQGWTPAPAWDAVAGDYAAADGWIRLHTNAPHHRAAALSVLGVAADKSEVARAVSKCDAADLEAAIVERGGCAGVMHSLEAWAVHPQGQAVAAEPLIHREDQDVGPPPAWANAPDRPLQGIRVLDLTRVLAGPVATRFLAGYGADVLRIDPPDWDEPPILPETTLGKRCARLDLRDPEGRAGFERLLRDADVLVHGYRSDALARLGYDAAERRRIRPGLVDVALDAYGWTGPWRARRGFDSIIQMSVGIADTGMRRLGKSRPTPLPAQALDHATGYLMAAAAIRGLAARLATGAGCEIKTSLARTAALLTGQPGHAPQGEFAPDTADDLAAGIEATAWGPAQRLSPPMRIDGIPTRWDRPAGLLGASPAAW